MKTAEWLQCWQQTMKALDISKGASSNGHYTYLRFVILCALPGHSWWLQNSRKDRGGISRWDLQTCIQVDCEARFLLAQSLPTKVHQECPGFRAWETGQGLLRSSGRSPSGPQRVKGPLGILSSWLGLSVILLSMIFMSSPLFMTLGCHHWPRPRLNTATYALISQNPSAYLTWRKCFRKKNVHMWEWTSVWSNALPGMQGSTSLKCWRLSFLKREEQAVKALDSPTWLNSSKWLKMCNIAPQITL